MDRELLSNLKLNLVSVYLIKVNYWLIHLWTEIQWSYCALGEQKIFLLYLSIRRQTYSTPFKCMSLYGCIRPYWLFLKYVHLLPDWRSEVKRGAPQGSVLRPLLFTFTNLLFIISVSFNCYTDDNQLFVPMKFKEANFTFLQYCVADIKW